MCIKTVSILYLIQWLLLAYQNGHPVLYVFTIVRNRRVDWTAVYGLRFVNKNDLVYCKCLLQSFSYSLFTCLWACSPRYILLEIKTMGFVYVLFDYQMQEVCFHDDVIKWGHFPRYWPFVWGIHRSPVNSPHRGQWAELNCFLWSAPE